MGKPGLSTADALVDAAIVGERSLLGAAARPLRFEVFETLAAAEPAWRSFEAHAVLTPYQRFDWVEALLLARGPGKGRLKIILVHETDRPVALLPLVITSALGLRTARIVGWDVGNADWMAVDPAFARGVNRAVLDLLLTEITRLTGADILALHSQPACWNGLANPLLTLPHQPAPEHFYAAPLSIDRLNAKRMRNIGRGRRRLEEAFGPVRMVRADTPDAIATIHAEFLRQRGIRFREMGIANVFAEDGFRRFFEVAARHGLGSPRPVLVMHALFAGDEIVATSIGSYCGNHYSQYINSTTDGPAAKYSLMGLLMFMLIEELRSDGITSIDMGLGDFAYKLDWTDQQVSYDGVIALTPVGQLGGAVLQGFRAAKRGIKQNPTLWRIATTVRGALNRGRAA